MKTIKLLFLFSIALSFSNCSTIKLTESAPFNVHGATYYNWIGGQPGVRGTNLIIGVNNHKEVTFKSIYFKNKKVNSSVERRKGKVYVIANISTSTRDQIKDIIESPTKKKTKVLEKKTDIPFQLKSNEAVVEYMVGKKIFYYKVKNIKKTESVFYP